MSLGQRAAATYEGVQMACKQARPALLQGEGHASGPGRAAWLREAFHKAYCLGSSSVTWPRQLPTNFIVRIDLDGWGFTTQA